MNPIEVVALKLRQALAIERAQAGRTRKGTPGPRRAWRRTVKPPKPMPIEHQHATQRRAAGMTPEARRALLDAYPHARRSTR